MGPGNTNKSITSSGDWAQAGLRVSWVTGLSCQWGGGLCGELAALAAAAGGAVGEVGGALLDPGDEGFDLIVREQGVDGVVVAREFGLGEDGVDLRVAGRVEDGDRAVGAATESRGEVVAALETGWDIAAAERADLHLGT